MSAPNARQRENLAKLGYYLENLPVDYQHFDMMFFLAQGHSELDPEELDTPELSHCGTVACAVGHTFAAGVIPFEDADLFENWDEVSERVYGVEMGGPVWDYLFDYSWATKDNTPHGAARRIYTYLSEGVPENY